MTAENDSVAAYEENLQCRRLELQNGDPAYELHKMVVAEAILFSMQLGASKEPWILDVGCGLGAMTDEMAVYWSAMGIDISERAIEMAREDYPGVPFYASSAGDFSQVMKQEKIRPFTHTLLNMVIHSIDDKSVHEVLAGCHSCMETGGALITIVPTDIWLRQKLIEMAIDKGMDRETGASWVYEQLQHEKVVVPFKLSGKDSHPNPITIYNRKIEDYGRMFQEAGFGVLIDFCNEETHEPIETVEVPFWIVDDYIASINNNRKNRVSLLTLKKE